MRRLVAALGLLFMGCSPGDQATSPRPSPVATAAAVVGNASAPRLIAASMAYDGERKQVVLFGTASSPSDGPIIGTAQPGSSLAETWTFKSGGWRKLAPAVSPPPRTWAGMAYDEMHQEVVLYGGGGRGLPLLQDTWTWDGKNWSKRTPVTSPPAASGPVLVYHRELGRVIALVDVQGQDVQGTLTQTWAWDGNTWAQLHPPTQPPGPRVGAAAAYYPAYGQIVVFGRSLCQDPGLCSENGDTWTFDGKTWTGYGPAPDGPSGRVGGTLAFDPSSSTVVLFGGASGITNMGNLRDTWMWRGSSWTLAQPTDSPWARMYANAVTDTTTGQVILYGGVFNSSTFGVKYSDVWTWGHGVWTLVRTTTIPAPPNELDAIVKAASVGPGLRDSCRGVAPPCVSLRGQPQLGFYAAYVAFDVRPSYAETLVCESYLSYIQPTAYGPWHQVGSVCGQPNGPTLEVGSRATVVVAGCANVRAFPQIGQVVGCLPNGTAVVIDDGPFAIAGDSKRLWWHAQHRGWIAHELLIAG